MVIQESQYQLACKEHPLHRYSSRPYSEIKYLEAFDNYCYIHYEDGGKDLISKCLKYLCQYGSELKFIKTHRKYAVNIDFIKVLHSDPSILELTSGDYIAVSRSRKKPLESILQCNG